jgi:hypothetical protein
MGRPDDAPYPQAARQILRANSVTPIAQTGALQSKQLQYAPHQTHRNGHSAEKGRFLQHSVMERWVENSGVQANITAQYDNRVSMQNYDDLVALIGIYSHSSGLRVYAAQPYGLLCWPAPLPP